MDGVDSRIFDVTVSDAASVLAEQVRALRTDGYRMLDGYRMHSSHSCSDTLHMQHHDGRVAYIAVINERDEYVDDFFADDIAAKVREDEHTI